MNHEYTDANQIYTAAQGAAITNDAAGREKVAKALAGHGVTVVEVRQADDGSWEHVPGLAAQPPDHRHHAGGVLRSCLGRHPMLQSEIGNPPAGTLNNCAHGVTPWGTYLACEENWNGYFGTDDPAWAPTALEARYGDHQGRVRLQLAPAEPRFDLAQNRKEVNRFGWVVEIDPHDPSSTPVKRTALGRIKHEGATVTEQNGRIVVYSGDDENGDYLYKFVGNAPWRQLRARGKSPLDEGTLYVAQFHADGTGTWLPLVHGTGGLTQANGYADQADVLHPDPSGGRHRRQRRGCTDLSGSPSTIAPATCSSPSPTAPVNSAAAVNSGRDRQPVRAHRPLPRDRHRAHADHVRLGRVPLRRRSRLPRARRHRTCRRTSRCSARPTASGSTPTGWSGSRPTSPTAPRTWPAGATTASATTRCWSPTPTPAR